MDLAMALQRYDDASALFREGTVSLGALLRAGVALIDSQLAIQCQLGDPGLHGRLCYCHQAAKYHILGAGGCASVCGRHRVAAQARDRGVQSFPLAPVTGFSRGGTIIEDDGRRAVVMAVDLASRVLYVRDGVDPVQEHVVPMSLARKAH